MTANTPSTDHDESKRKAMILKKKNDDFEKKNKYEIIPILHGYKMRRVKS